MVDFSNYAGLREDGTESKPYAFEDIDGVPTLLCRPATSANKRYNSARLKAISKRTNSGRKKARISSASVDAARREDAEMLADYCVVGWKPAPVDSAKQPVDFSAENCRQFFLAIPDWMFDDFRAWVSDPVNFAPDTGDDEEEPDTPGESQSSSPSGSDGSAASAETVTQ